MLNRHGSTSVFLEYGRTKQVHTQSWINAVMGTRKKLALILPEQLENVSIGDL